MCNLLNAVLKWKLPAAGVPVGANTEIVVVDAVIVGAERTPNVSILKFVPTRIPPTALVVAGGNIYLLALLSIVSSFDLSDLLIKPAVVVEASL